MTIEPSPETRAHREADVALRDGTTAHVRPIRPDDEPDLLAFLRSLPEDDRRLRFFSASSDLASAAHAEACTDEKALGLVATAGSAAHIVAHAEYVPLDDNTAEIAFVVGEGYQGRGLATLLLGQLAQAAAEHGVQTFQALVLPENRRMIDVLRRSGFPIQSHYGPDGLEVRLPTTLSPEALRQFDEREREASAAALKRVLSPGSVAIVGASRQHSSVGAAVVRNLLSCGFPGPIYPINPAANQIQGLPCYPNLDSVAQPIDLAVIAVPAAHVVEVAEASGRSGVRALVVLSAGFTEIGPVGHARQADLLRVCRTYGMRLVGPNCIGVIDTDPRAPLNATFGPLMPTPGRIALASQSGALGLAAIDFAAERGLGFSSIISMGNKADISGNDLLGYWHTDQRTDVILLYLESFGNPRKFGRLAREVGRSKPIVAVKSGRSAVGARATASHTGGLLAASDVTVDALFRQAGVIRTESMDEMLDVAALLVDQPLPAGARVGIVTNVGGPAVMCADACEAVGLTLPLLSEATLARLHALLPAEASVANPVDMLASAPAEHYAEAVRVLAGDQAVDAIIAIFLPPLATRAEDVAQALVRVADELAGSKPLLAVFMASGERPRLTLSSTRHVPCYVQPEAAAKALGHCVRYAAWRRQPVEEATEPGDLRREEARVLISAALTRGGGWLEPGEVRGLLDCYGISNVPQRVVATTSEAGRVSATLGGDVALKAIAPGVVHKSDVGAVRLGLGDPGAVWLAAEEMVQHVHDASGSVPTGFVVQRMAEPGVEMLVGVVNDPLFGPTIACGAGGTLVELLKDVAVRLSPLTRAEAATMLRELRSFPLLEGYRGAARCDISALEDVLIRISAMAEDHPTIAELDCNPLIVSASGAVVVDARARVQPAQAPPLLGARR